MYTQLANLNFAMKIEGKPKMLNPREMLKTHQFRVTKSYYTDGTLTTVIQFL